jgi:hypothetical protein
MLIYAASATASFLQILRLKPRARSANLQRRNLQLIAKAKARGIPRNRNHIGTTACRVGISEDFIQYQHELVSRITEDILVQPAGNVVVANAPTAGWVRTWQAVPLLGNEVL